MTYDSEYFWCVASDSIYKLLIESSDSLNVKVINYDTTKFPLIEASVSVKDHNKNFVSNLLATNFVVLENGFNQSSIDVERKNITQVISFALIK